MGQTQRQYVLSMKLLFFMDFFTQLEVTLTYSDEKVFELPSAPIAVLIKSFIGKYTR